MVYFRAPSRLLPCPNWPHCIRLCPSSQIVLGQRMKILCPELYNSSGPTKSDLLIPDLHRGSIQNLETASIEMAKSAQRTATRYSLLATRHSPLATRHSPLATRHSKESSSSRWCGETPLQLSAAVAAARGSQSPAVPWLPLHFQAMQPFRQHAW